MWGGGRTAGAPLGQPPESASCGVDSRLYSGGLLMAGLAWKGAVRPSRAEGAAGRPEAVMPSYAAAGSGTRIQWCGNCAWHCCFGGHGGMALLRLITQQWGLVVEHNGTARGRHVTIPHPKYHFHTSSTLRPSAAWDGNEVAEFCGGRTSNGTLWDDIFKCLFAFFFFLKHSHVEN